jgi:hypothetical protein
MTQSTILTGRHEPLALMLLIAATALACASPRPLPSFAKRARPLALGDHVRGSTAGWDWRTGPGGDIWAFDAPRTASYEVHARSRDHAVGVELFTMTERRTATLGSAWAPAGAEGKTSRPLGPGQYWLNVDGDQAARGAYELWVDVDQSSGAAIRAEDAGVVAPLCGAAPVLTKAGAMGTFESLPGGLRASCGGTGSSVVYRVEVSRAGTISIPASAELRLALELRSACAGRVEACVAPGAYDATLTAAVAAGTHYLVVDTVEIGELDTGIPGAAVRGAYSIGAVTIEDAQ